MLCESNFMPLYTYNGNAETSTSLIDFNYFFSGYLSDAYWGSWLFVTHDLDVSYSVYGLFAVYPAANGSD